MEWYLHECFDFKNHCMKKYFLILGAVLIVVSCKSKKEGASAQNNSAPAGPTTTTVTTTETVTTTTTTESKPTAEMNVPVGNTIGKVSHKFRATGCATVIIVDQDGNELVLIPKDKLVNDLDVDGLQINFNYRTLKMPQPAGCSKGIPAEITDISKK
jgi:hypothetical protein